MGSRADPEAPPGGPIVCQEAVLTLFCPPGGAAGFVRGQRFPSPRRPLPARVALGLAGARTAAGRWAPRSRDTFGQLTTHR